MIHEQAVMAQLTTTRMDWMRYPAAVVTGAAGMVNATRAATTYKAWMPMKMISSEMP